MEAPLGVMEAASVVEGLNLAGFDGILGVLPFNRMGGGGGAGVCIITRQKGGAVFNPTFFSNVHFERR